MEFDKKHECWTMSAKSYIKNTAEKIEKMFNIVLRNYGSPLEAGDHPELDETDLLPPGEITKYQMMIGCAQWAVTLGRFDVMFATNTLARFATAPREGHLKRCFRLFGYLKHNAKAKTYFDPTPLDISGIVFTKNDWTELYPDAQELLPPSFPEPRTPKLRFVVFKDASQGTDITTMRGCSGSLFFLGRTVIKAYSKRQNTVESSSYGAELVSLRSAIESVIALRYKLRMMGVAFEETTPILGDNKSVVTNMQSPSSSLKKKHQYVCFNLCREAVASRICKIGFLPGKENPSDIMTKAVGPQSIYKFCTSVQYRRVSSVTDKGELQTSVSTG